MKGDFFRFTQFHTQTTTHLISVETLFTYAYILQITSEIVASFTYLFFFSHITLSKI